MGDDCLNQMMVTGEVYSLSLFFLLLCVFENVLFSILEGCFLFVCFKNLNKQ